MKRDGIAEPSHLDAPEPPAPGEVHVWRVALPAAGRATARAATRSILAAYLGIEAGAVELVGGEGGKPRLAAPAALSFNLSHAAGLGLIAIAAVEVGIDVERLRPRRDLARLAARRLPAADAEAVAKASEAEREGLFYAAWTRHEARVKCAGTGIFGPPPRPEVVAIPLEIDSGYAAALAFEGPPDRTIVHRFDFPE
jgi:phosphopantetheinyl transferase